MSYTTNPGHLTKLFSSALLGAFLSDLETWPTHGRPEHLYAATCRWLDELTDVAATLPDGNLPGRKIHERCAAVAQAYRQWYGSKEGASRERWRRRLRKRVNALATAYRVRTKLLEEEVDLSVPRAMVDATARLLLLVPDMCGTLAHAMRGLASRVSRPK